MGWGWYNGRPRFCEGGVAFYCVCKFKGKQEEGVCLDAAIKLFKAEKLHRS